MQEKSRYKKVLNSNSQKKENVRIKNKSKERKKNFLRINTRITFVFFVFTFILLILLCVVAYFKIAKGQEYEMASIITKTSNNDVSIAPKRGTILDRSGQVLAMSTRVYNVILDAKVLMDKSNDTYRDYTVTRISELLNIQEEKLKGYLQANENGNYSQYKILANKVGRELSDVISQEITDNKLKGIWLETTYKRTYPAKTLASAVIGFTNDEKGQWGIENKYDTYLTGISGRSFVTYEDGTSMQKNVIEAVDGNTIVTTIDPTIQRYAEIAVENAMSQTEPQNAAIIVMNPNTGEVLAMCSSPGFDLNSPRELSEQGVNEANMTQEEIAQARYKIWGNYNISYTYEPGSTFKPIVMAAALEEEIISLDDTFNCIGHKQVADYDIKCWKTSGHGEQTLEQILANSCNVAMMQIGELMGKEIMYKYQRAFGFGEKTGIDLPGEASASTLLHSLSTIYDVELATMSFGQTFNATPIQLLNAFAAVINGGNLLKPYVVSQIIDEDNRVIFKNEATIERKVISKQTSDTIRKYLQSVLELGTGRKAKIDGYAIGGKTGTAEQGSRSVEEKEYIISFVGFLPVENPEVIALAIIDRPVEGDETTAAPMMKELLENVIRYMGFEQTEELTGASVKNVPIENYIGFSLTEVTKELTMLGLNYNIYGTGSIVANQVPKAGEQLKESSTVILYVTKSGESEEVMVPNLVGKTYEEASEQLKQLGLVIVTEGVQNGLVSEQEPKEGKKVELGGNVKIRFTVATE